MWPFKKNTQEITLKGLEAELRLRQKLALEDRDKWLKIGKLNLNFPIHGMIVLRLWIFPHRQDEGFPKIFHESGIQLTATTTPEAFEPFIGFKITPGQSIEFDFFWNMIATGFERHPSIPQDPIELGEDPQ